MYPTSMFKRFLIRCKISLIGYNKSPSEGKCFLCGNKSILDESNCYKYAALYWGPDEFHKASRCQKCYDRDRAYKKAIDDPANKDKDINEFTRDFLVSYKFRNQL